MLLKIRSIYYEEKFVLLLIGFILASVCTCSKDRKATIVSESTTLIEPTAPGQAEKGTDNNADLTLAPDLNHNGIIEEVRLTNLDDGQGRQLEIWENNQRLNVETAYFSHPGWANIFLCTLDGKDYLLRYHPTMYQGVCSYDYALSTLADGNETVIQSNRIDFDINFGSPIHDSFDPEAIAAFMDEINDLFSHSVPMLCTDTSLLDTFEKEGKLYDRLWWLDDREPEFIRDNGKSLLENLRDFQIAMTAFQELIVPQETDGLPITQTLGMSFYSGAGAWQTFLGLNPDGSFSGEYSDADADEVYLCHFHGKFGKVEKLTDASWLLMLEELVLDTGRSVGEEWEETDGDYAFHFISSDPYGLNGLDGATLKPGAQFILYSPDAIGHEPGTELYGATEFQSWMHNHREFNSADDTLGCWGLQNLETGQGFFEDSRYNELDGGRIYGNK